MEVIFTIAIGILFGFEYGLYGFLIIEPPDAYDPYDGKNVGGYPRRTAANLRQFTEFSGFKGGNLESGDPHAMSVSYDVEALWVIDDIDSNWRKEAHNIHVIRLLNMGIIQELTMNFISDKEKVNSSPFMITTLTILS